MTDGGQTAAHSETETAKGTADHTAREYWRADIQCRVCNMGTYSPEELISGSFVLFVIAAMGSDAEPQTKMPQWNLLLRSDPPYACPKTWTSVSPTGRLRIRQSLLARKKDNC
ncbi:hypothetical protein EDC04DRAFT_2685385 [Pisolithus marmoratus]|nr:hypothetical protein EDC04DRAFT_2685385 [Pisolithus marmoratus]